MNVCQRQKPSRLLLSEWYSLPKCWQPLSSSCIILYPCPPLFFLSLQTSSQRPRLWLPASSKMVWNEITAVVSESWGCARVVEELVFETFALWSAIMQPAALPLLLCRCWDNVQPTTNCIVNVFQLESDSNLTEHFHTWQLAPEAKFVPCVDVLLSICWDQCWSGLGKLFKRNGGALYFKVKQRKSTNNITESSFDETTMERWCNVLAVSPRLCIIHGGKHDSHALFVVVFLP